MGSCYGFDLPVAEFVFDRGEHAERGVAALAVVEDLFRPCAGPNSDSNSCTVREAAILTPANTRMCA